MALLGLLMDGPDSAARLGDRFWKEYGHGNWTRSVVSNSLDGLVKNGHAELRPRAKPAWSIYEATSYGTDFFKEWLQEAVGHPKPIREPIQVWLERSTEAELPEILRTIRALEDHARKQYQAAQVRLNCERDEGRLGPADGSDWQGRMRNATLSHLAVTWEQEEKLWKKLRLVVANEREMHAPVSEAER
jgi:hypothetical protein